MRALVAGFALLAAACSSARYGASDTGAPSVTLPTRFAEGHNERAADAGALPAASAAPSAASNEGDVPDPDPPLRSASQWEYALHYDKGEVTVTSVRRVELDRPVLSPRRIGRFAFELWIGKELVERVRFDFPLLAADLPPPGKKRPLRDPPRFSPGADTVAEVRIPASDRATRAELVDRLTGRRIPVTWPPEVSPAPVRSGGVPGAGGGPGEGAPPVPRP